MLFVCKHIFQISNALCYYFKVQYGRIVDIDLKLPPRPPGYCFIEVSNEEVMLKRIDTYFIVIAFMIILEIAVRG